MKMHQKNNFFRFRLCFKDTLKEKNENAGIGKKKIFVSFEGIL